MRIISPKRAIDKDSDAAEGAEAAKDQHANDPSVVEVDDPDNGDAEEDAAPTSGTVSTSDEPKQRRRVHRQLSFAVSSRALLVGSLVAVLASGMATSTWLYLNARQRLDGLARASSNSAHAEKVALDYAVNAAVMNFQDLRGWKSKLVAGTSPALDDKLTKAAASIEQILVPLQWVSTAKPLAAKVRSSDGGSYTVDCFVSVETKTVQAPDPLPSTATYSVVVDGNKNWQITDVGGIGSVLGER